MSLIAEVPLLQIFDSDIGDITWIKLLIAVLSVLCLCSALLDISLVLHKTVSILHKTVRMIKPTQRTRALNLLKMKLIC